MARRSISSGVDDSTEINLSPMIDCIFILLIFFIVTTVFVEESGFQVNKPDASAAPPQEEIESISIEITKDDRILFNGSRIDLGQLQRRVSNALDDPATPVSIKAHGESHHGIFVAIWDAARLAGAEKLSFSTVN
jgi:biopolymer transport protein ExbD